MRKHLYVDNVDLATYGVYISGAGTFTAPEKVHEWYEVPNKNGAVLGIERRLRNIQVSYKCFICTNLDANIRDLRNFLLSRDGLVRIADDYHSDEYRMGVYSGPFEPTITTLFDAGNFVLSFDCLPQRWLTSGEVEASQSITPSSTTKISLTVTNPTNFPSRPLLKVYGTGTLTVNGTDIIISDTLPSSVSYLIIDCDTMTIYRSGYDTNYNPYVSMRSANEYGVDFPTLKSGNNTISTAYNQNISQVKVTPRWWRV